MDVIVQHSSINTINENERMLISTSNTNNYSDNPSTTDNDNNDNNTLNLQSSIKKEITEVYQKNQRNMSLECY